MTSLVLSSVATAQNMDSIVVLFFSFPVDDVDVIYSVVSSSGPPWWLLLLVLVVGLLVLLVRAPPLVKIRLFFTKIVLSGGVAAMNSFHELLIVSAVVVL